MIHFFKREYNQEKVFQNFPADLYLWTESVLNIKDLLDIGDILIIVAHQLTGAV